MFELLSAKLLDKKEVTLSKPNEIIILENGVDKPVIYDIEKAASTFMYKQLGATASTCKELYKNNEPMWKSYIDSRLEDKDGRPAPFKFEYNDVRYVADNNYSLIDMSIMSDDYYEDFKSRLETYNMEINSLEHTNKFYFNGTGGLVKLVLYRAGANLVENDYTPVVVLEVNNKKAEYSIYTGILIYKSFAFIPSMNPVATYQSYIDFIMSINILGTLQLAEESGQDLYHAYLDFKTGHAEISARELIRILNRVGCKLELKEDLSLDDISNLQDEEANRTIKDFFNSFVKVTGETAEDILNLSEIRKVFKYNKLTIVDLLEILSKEYLKDDTKVSAQILSDLVFGLYTKKIDNTDAKSVIEDINNR